MILSPAEIEALTRRKRFKAQVRVLVYLGIPHRLRPDGSPVVMAQHATLTSVKQEPRLRL